jgi:hypothetical protein
MVLILYRAMCAEEMNKTIHYQSLQFNRNREKCFSPSLDWILNNPCNGNFNNSNIKKDRYKHILQFIFTDESIKGFTQRRNEWKIHCRKRNSIQLIAINQITRSNYGLFPHQTKERQRTNSLLS